MLVSLSCVGTFELLSTSSTVSSGGEISATVHRIGGTAGLSTIGVSITQPNDVLLRCDCTNGYGCACGMHLASSGAISQPGYLSFEDGQEYQNVSISVWEDDESVLQPMSVVLGLFGTPSSLAPQNEVLLRIDLSQRPGFVAFAHSRKEILENSSYVKFNVIRLNGSSGNITFDVETFDMSGVAYKHYIPVQTSMQLVDRQSAASVWVKIINNIYYEGARVFGVRLLGKSHSAGVTADHSKSIVTKKVVVLDDEDASKVLPGVPTSVDIVRITGGQMEIQWESPASNATTSGYLVRITKGGAQSNYFSLYNTTSLSLTLSSLPPRSSYSAGIAAWNKFGAGSYSDIVSATTTEPTPPSAPTAVQVDFINSSVVAISWLKPQDSGGSPITNYSVAIETPSADRYELGYAAFSNPSFTVTDLNASTAYIVFITAGSAAFPASNVTQHASAVFTTANGSLPTQPPAVTLLKQPTGGTLSFQIHEPRHRGGLPILDYSLHLRKVLETTTTAGSDPQQQQSGTESSSFDVVCTGMSPMVNSTRNTCTVYKLLSGSTYEAYATLYNSVVREKRRFIHMVFNALMTVCV